MFVLVERQALRTVSAGRVRALESTNLLSKIARQPDIMFDSRGL